MKSGYKRLLVFDCIIIAILLLNNFVSSILNGYVKVGFIVILLLIFRLFFDYEKDRHRYWKSICLEITIFLLVYFIIYYLSGLVFSFYRPINYFTFTNIVNIIIPLIAFIILKELLRYFILVKAEGSKLVIVITCITFILLDLVPFYSLDTFKSSYSIFMFFALSVLPYVSMNIVCTYITCKCGYKPTMYYILVMELYTYILPLIPNPNEYIYAVYQLIAPFILLYRVYLFYKTERDEELVRVYNKRRFIALIPSTLIIVFLVYFTSGYFYYHAVVVGSGSMEPKIHKGDVVLIEKEKIDFDKIEIGQVIAYKYDDRIIIHRLVNKIRVNGECFYYTKGDANNDIDNYKITSDMLVGVVNKKVPYIGYPTVWLNDL